MSKEYFKSDAQILRFIEYLYNKGIQLWGEGNKIRYKAKINRLTPEIIEVLKMEKQRILDFLYRLEKHSIPLTPIQTAYVIGQNTEYELGNTNAHYYIEYKIENLNIKRFEQALNIVIKKNDALRMVILNEEKASFLEEVPYYIISEYALGNESDRIKKRKQRSHYRYNYHHWPMFHFCIGKGVGKESILHIDFDCIILDAWSARIMLDEIFDLYYENEIIFPEITFEEYIKISKKENSEEAEKYWREQVNYIPDFPQLPFQKKPSEVREINVDRVEYNFSTEETKRLYMIIKQNHFTPAAVLATLFMKSLSKYSSEPRVAINVTAFNRQALHRDVNKLLGEFTNVAVIYLDSQRSNTLEDIKKIQMQMWKLVQYREFDGTHVLKMLAKGEPGKAVMPIVFTSMLNGDNLLKRKIIGNYQEEFAISQTPQVILDHHARDDLGFLKISWDFIIELFDKKTILEIFNTYVSEIKKFMNDN